MVNTGHPSRACKICRVRRIKCDELKPACMKCQKSGWICPGHKSAFDLKLRDETQSVIRKAKIAHRRTSLKESESSPRSRYDAKKYRSMASKTTAISISMPSVYSPCAELELEVFPGISKKWSNLPFSVIQPGWSLDANNNADVNNESLARLTIPLDQQAKCFFLPNFVVSPPEGLGRGVLTFLLSLLETPVAHSTVMAKAFSTISMVALSRRSNSRTLLNQAQEYYCDAITQLDADLRDSIKAKEDTTWAAAILLSFYEVNFFFVLYP